MGLPTMFTRIEQRSYNVKKKAQTAKHFTCWYKAKFIFTVCAFGGGFSVD